MDASKYFSNTNSYGLSSKASVNEVDETYGEPKSHEKKTETSLQKKGTSRLLLLFRISSELSDLLTTFFCCLFREDRLLSSAVNECLDWNPIEGRVNIEHENVP